MNDARNAGVLRVREDDPLRAEAFLHAGTVQSHAANLMPLPSGELGCAWFGGTQEGLSDIDVWFARLGGNGEWTAPIRLSSDPHCSEQNPVLFPAPNGEMWLLYTAQHGGNQDTAEVRVRVSPDEGRSWGPVRVLLPASEHGGVFVRQPIAITDSGRWVLPVFHCPRPKTGRWRGDHDTSAVYVSDDQGTTWQHYDVPNSTGCVHMNVLVLDDGTLLALFRRRQADSIYHSRSRDGKNWTEPTPTELPNNNSSIQAVTLRSGRLGLVFNASSAQDAQERRAGLYDEIDESDGESAADPDAADNDGIPVGAAFWGAPRAPLTLAFSDDNGATWQRQHTLETGDGYCLTNNSRDGLNRELSYPSLAETDDGALHVALTRFRQAIKHIRLAPEWGGE